MTLFLLIVFGIYFFLLVMLIIGWERTMKQKATSEVSVHHSITVLIPFRNEASHLPKIVTDLIAQNYLPDFVTVLFIDDHSTDNSVEVLNSCIKNQSNFKLISLPTEWTGKKRAIDYGVQAATSELIVTTDADCQVPETWLSSINNSFQDERTKLVFGGVKISDGYSVFSKLQALEFSSLIGSGAATLGFGIPTMCNGANLAYRRSAYLEVNGFENNFEVASGDDEFLMRKISTKFPDSIFFLSDKQAVVSTLPQFILKDFINQRLRWAGKWKYNQSFVAQLLALFVLTFHTSFVISVVIAFSGEGNLRLIIVLIGIKILLEFIFLSRVNSFLNQPFRPIYFLILQFIHPLYVIVIGFLSQRGRYSWKGRSLTHKL